MKASDLFSFFVASLSAFHPTSATDTMCNVTQEIVNNAIAGESIVAAPFIHYSST
jgi:hypothetical protein